MMICAAKPKRAGRKKKNPMNSSILLITQAQVVANAGSSTYEVHARVQVHRASARAFQGGPKRRLHPIKVEVLTNHAQEQQMEETWQQVRLTSSRTRNLPRHQPRPFRAHATYRDSTGPWG